MKTSSTVSITVDPKQGKIFPCRILSTVFLLSMGFLIGSALLVTDYKEMQFTVYWFIFIERMFLRWKLLDNMLNTGSKLCEAQCRPHGAESLPRSIASMTSDLQMQPLWGSRNKKNSKSVTNLLAMAVGIKQKESVNKIVNKFQFLSSNFVVVLFHYDGIVDQWRDLQWCDHAIHVSAVNQKNGGLPSASYIQILYMSMLTSSFGMKTLELKILMFKSRYLAIVKDEGLEISQPALDPDLSEVHHDFTARDNKLKMHRKINKVISSRRKCDDNSTNPPCTGFVEMMAPVFSKASWRCVWHMIQNDLVHAWGLDFQLGYCAQGDRTQNIGIVDAQYIVHCGLPTLGGLAANKATLPSNQTDARSEVRKQSYVELEIFKRRLRKAIKEDTCWNDPF